MQVESFCVMLNDALTNIVETTLPIHNYHCITIRPKREMYLAILNIIFYKLKWSKNED